ncbi:hypothetical protein SARC_08815, partial [Sphaeroforma arctica JP610]
MVSTKNQDLGIQEGSNTVAQVFQHPIINSVTQRAVLPDFYIRLTDMDSVYALTDGQHRFIIAKALLVAIRYYMLKIYIDLDCTDHANETTYNACIQLYTDIRSNLVDSLGKSSYTRNFPDVNKFMTSIIMFGQAAYPTALSSSVAGRTDELREQFAAHSTWLETYCMSEDQIALAKKCHYARSTAIMFRAALNLVIFMDQFDADRMERLT